MKREREHERRKRKCPRLQIRYKGKSLILDGELMKPRPDMTVQCQTAKSYAGRWALAAISLQIVCVCVRMGGVGGKQEQVKKTFIKKVSSPVKCRHIFRHCS